MSNIALYIGLIFVMFSRNDASPDNSSQYSSGLSHVGLHRKMACKYTNLQQKEVGKLNPTWMSISGQKAVIVQGIQDDIVAGFVEQNERVRKATFKGRMFSRHPLPVMNGMSLVNTAIVIFCRFCGLAERSKYRNNDSPRLDCHVCPISQQYYQPIIQVAAVGEPSWPLLGQIVSKKCSMQKKRFVRKMPLPLRNCEGVEISHIDFSYVPDKPILKRCQHFSPKADDSSCRPDWFGENNHHEPHQSFHDVDAGSISFDGKRHSWLRLGQPAEQGRDCLAGFGLV